MATPPSRWSAQELAAWLRAEGVRTPAAESIELSEVGGDAFLALTEDDLMEADELGLDAFDVGDLLRAQAKLERLERPAVGAAASDAGGGSWWDVPSVSVDSEGRSYFSEKRVRLGSPSGGNAIGALSQMLPASGILFRETPADYDFEWHTAPRRQFIVCLDAGVDIEVADGTRRVFSLGTVFYVEDTWGKGHRSRAVDGKPRKSLFIAVPDDFHF